MEQVLEGIDTSMAMRRSTGYALPTFAVVRPCHVPAVRPWHGSLFSTMPSLGEGHGEATKAILANGTRRLKEPST